jgi:hypothetical protein
LRPCLRCGFVSDGLMPWAIMIGPTPNFPFLYSSPSLLALLKSSIESLPFFRIRHFVCIS